MPLGFVATIEDLLGSEQYQARGFWQTLDHPATGPVQYPGHPYHLTGIDLPAGRPPVPGEHTDQIMRGVLSMSDDQINEYRAHDII